MNLIVSAINLYLLFLIMYAASFMFMRRLERRKLWWLRYICCFVVMFGICYAMALFKKTASMSLVNDGELLFFLLTCLINFTTYFVILSLSVLGIPFIYRVDFSETIFIGGALYEIQSVSYGLFHICMKARGYELLNQFNLAEHLNDPLNLFILIALLAVVCVTAYFLGIRSYERVNSKATKKTIFIIIGFVTVILLFNSVSTPPESEVAADGLYSIMLVAKILLSCCAFFIQFQLEKFYNLEYVNWTNEQMMAKHREQFKIAKESMETVNINAHDLRKQISLILKAIEENGAAKVPKQVDELEKALAVVETTFNTGNEALDVTLTEKMKDCYKKNINLSVIADGNSLRKIDDIDIYMLFGNLLDNAIEAVEKIPDKAERNISFSVKEMGGVILMHIENTMLKKPEFVDGFPVTTKSDKNFHGFGMKSIKKIVGKYGGGMKINPDNGRFCIDIALNP